MKETKEDSETAIMNAKYGIIHGALHEAGCEEGTKTDTYQTTHVIDSVITNKYVGFPLFFLFLYVMFEVTFTLGQYPMDWIDAGVAALGDLARQTLPDGPLKAMLADGVIAGVGSVIVFLPQILILYAFISFMEDSGYMARAAFIMDKAMHKMGLHGKSFIPLIMGFGCNVPAVMATRTIESRRSRLITILVLPLMSCSARLPIYIMIIGTFFAAKYQSLIMISLYIVGIVLAVLVSRLFSRWMIKGDDTPFVMEPAPLPLPHGQGHGAPHMGKGQAIPEKDGRHNPRCQHYRMGFGLFPTQRQPWDTGTAGTKLHRPDRQGHRAGVPRTGLRLEVRRKPHCRRRRKGDSGLDYGSALR